MDKPTFDETVQNGSHRHLSYEIPSPLWEGDDVDKGLERLNEIRGWACDHLSKADAGYLCGRLSLISRLLNEMQMSDAWETFSAFPFFETCEFRESFADNGVTIHVCSRCGYTVDSGAIALNDFNYCPKCGAQTVGEKG